LTSASSVAWVAGREDVGEHREVQLVIVTLGELQGVEVRERHPQVLGLAAGVGAHRHVAVGAAGEPLVDGEAEAGLVRLAVAAEPAGDVEGQDDAVALLQLRDAVTDLLDDAHVLVPEDDPRLGAGAALVHVQVGAADGRRRDLDDHVGRVLDAGVIDLVDRDLVRLLVDDGSHALGSSWLEEQQRAASPVARQVSVPSARSLPSGRAPSTIRTARGGHPCGCRRDELPTGAPFDHPRFPILGPRDRR
jgi:hypothetical protein